MRPVATASAVTDNVSHPPAVTGHGPVTRPNTVQVGTIVWLASELMFFAFIAGQVYEYANLVSEGVTLSSDQYGSIFFFSTGFHALHVSGGLVAFLLIIARTFTSRRYDHKQAVGAVVTSYYWHFVDVVWIALFSTIYLLR